jgi:calcium/calmodulin-dependent protein kinase I
LHEKLGSGTFATVRRVVLKEDNAVQKALKITSLRNLKSEEVEALKNEVTILGICSHPHVVQLYESYITSDKIYMVQDLLSGGELFDRIIEQTFFSEVEAAKVVYQIADALNYLHQQDIVHRDLKPENLLLTDKSDTYQVKIIDFGLAKQSKELMSMPCGTPGYVAPEILKRRKYHKEVDIWSLGVITYILLCGFPPFHDDGNNLKNLYKQIRAGKYSFPKKYWSNISKEAILLIKMMLQVKPRSRISAEKILTHKWVVTHTGEHAAAQNLNSTHYGNNMRKTRAIGKLRKGVRIIMALKKLSHLLDQRLDR